MPLIVPGIFPTSTGTSDAEQDWKTKLLGKKIVDAGASNDLVIDAQALVLSND